MTHFIERCTKCDAVITQCRCMSPSKDVIKQRQCAECSKT